FFLFSLNWIRYRPPSPRPEIGGAPSESLGCPQFNPVPGNGTLDPADGTRVSVAGATPASRHRRCHRLLRRLLASPKGVRRPRRWSLLPVPARQPLGAILGFADNL